MSYDPMYIIALAYLPSALAFALMVHDIWRNRDK